MACPTMSRWVSMADRRSLRRRTTADLHYIFFSGEEDAEPVVVDALEAQSSDVQSIAAGSESFGAHSRAGMTKTSTCELHDTRLDGCRQTSMCELHDTDRGLCRGVSSGSEGRTELRRRGGDGIITVLALPVLVVRRGFRGMFRNQATRSML